MRIGLAAGPVVLRFGDVYGSTVNIASRLTSLARPGSVLVDRVMAEQLGDDERFALRSKRPESVRGYHHLHQWRLRRADDTRSDRRAATSITTRADPAPVTLGSVMKTFDQLFAELTDRQRERPAGSATVAALDGGVHEQGKKVVEEAAEVWLAAEHESAERTAEEISQLLYRVQVIMLGKGIALEDVYRHL